MKIHEWKNKEINRLLMEKFALSEGHCTTGSDIEEDHCFEEDIEEGVGSELGHIALDVVGIVPEIGEAADIANAIWYLQEAERFREEGDGYEATFAYLFALLSAASLAGAVAPFIGDLIPKAGKYAAQVARLTGYVAKGGKEANKLRATLQAKKPLIDSTVKQLASKDSRFTDAIPYMMGALGLFASGREPTKGDDVESLEQAAAEYGSETVQPADDGETVVNLGSEEEKEKTMSELKAYIKAIVSDG